MDRPSSIFLSRLLLATLPLAACALAPTLVLPGCGSGDTAGIAPPNTPDGSSPVDGAGPPPDAAGVDSPAVDGAGPPVDGGVQPCDAGLTCGVYCCTATAPATVACSDPGAADNRCLITLSTAQYTGPVRVGAGYVYFVTGDGTPQMTISRVPVGGGATETVVSDPQLSLYTSSFAVDANNIYWVDQFSGDGGRTGAVLSQPLAGGSVTTIATGQTGPLGIGVNASGVYWIDWLEVDNDAGAVIDTSMVMTPGPDGGPSVVAAAPGPPRSLGLNTSTAYFTAAGNGTPGTVYSAALGGSGATATVVATSQSNPAEIAVNDLTLAWTNESTNTTFFTGGDLVCQPLQDGGIAGSNTGSAKALALDDADVFFSLDTADNNGVVASNLVSLNEGIVFKGMQNVQGIAIDATSVYISDATGIHQLSPR